ncbi:MAG: glycosyltransferase family 4 protein, partial [Gemmatimonadales bacterium]|nr:glycosyltransferase family 4 protein [Gemmatimonadales bacterium]
VLRFSGAAGGPLKLRSALQHIEVVLAPLLACARPRARRPNLLVCVQPLFAGLGGLLAGRLFRIPYVVLVHGEELALLHDDRLLFGLRRRLQARVLAGAAAVVCNSRNTLLLASKLYGIPDTRLQLIYPSIPTAERASLGDTLAGLDSSARVILMAGRLDERHKGFDTAIEALPAIVRAMPEARLVIAGPGDPAALIERARELGVADRVLFTGVIERSALNALFERCELFVLPGREVDGAAEGFGIVFLEAARAGKPVVAGRTGGAPEAVIDGETGLLVDGRSPAAVAEAVLRLLGDRALAQRLGRCGRDRVRREFDGRRQHREFDRLIQTLVGHTPLTREGQ